MYNTEEKITIVNWYKGNNTVRSIRDLFSVNYPNRPIPSIGTIYNIIAKFNTEGCIVNLHKKR